MKKITKTENAKYNAGVECARADIHRHGFEYSSRVPEASDHPVWANGYIRTLPTKYQSAIRSRIATERAKKEKPLPC